MIDRLACALLLLVWPETASAQTRTVAYLSECHAERHTSALARELAVVQLRLTPYAATAAPDPGSARQALAQAEASVLLVLDRDCNARILGVNGQVYTLHNQPDVTAWAVRIAETLYALSPYAARAAPEAAGSETRAASAEPRPRHELSLIAGPLLVSGANDIALRLDGDVALTLLDGLDVAVRAGVTLPALQVGSDTLGAEAQLVLAGLEARARLPLPSTRLSLQAVLGAGGLWFYAEGTAQAPRINRKQARLVAALSAGAELTFWLARHWGLRLGTSVTLSAPRLALQLGASERLSLARLQAVLLLGPVARF